MEKIVSKEEKNKWIGGIGKDSYISLSARMNIEFFNTSCLLTAAVLRNRLTSQLDWRTVFVSEEEQNVIFELNKIPLFQISFGLYDEYDYHHIIISDGYVYQSHYLHTEWDCRPLSVNKLDKHYVPTDTLEKLTGFTFSEPLSYVISIPF